MTSPRFQKTSHRSREALCALLFIVVCPVEIFFRVFLGMKNERAIRCWRHDKVKASRTKKGLLYIIKVIEQVTTVAQQKLTLTHYQHTHHHGRRISSSRQKEKDEIVAN